MDEFTTEVLAMMRVRIINQRSLETYVYNYVGGGEGGGQNVATDLIGYSRSRLLEFTRKRKYKKLANYGDKHAART